MKKRRKRRVSTATSGRKRTSQPESELEQAFIAKWVRMFPGHLPKREFGFSTVRKYRFDFAWPSKKFAVEVHGYGPGHYSVPGMTQDFDKHLEAVRLSWTVVYLTSTHVSSSRIKDTLLLIGYLMSLKTTQPPNTTIYIPLKDRRE